MAWYVSGRNCAALACMCSGVCLCVCVCVCVCSRVCAYVCVHFRSWWARRHQGCEYGLLKVCHTKWDAGSPYKTAEKLPLLHQHHHLCLTWVRTQLQARLLAQTSATIARTKTYTHKHTHTQNTNKCNHCLSVSNKPHLRWIHRRQRLCSQQHRQRANSRRKLSQRARRYRQKQRLHSQSLQKPLLLQGALLCLPSLSTCAGCKCCVCESVCVLSVRACGYVSVCVTCKGTQIMVGCSPDMCGEVSAEQVR